MDQSNPYASPRSDLTPPAGTQVDITGPFDPQGRFSRLSWLAWNLVLGVVGGLVGTVVVLIVGALGLAAMPQPNAASNAAGPILGVLVVVIPYLVLAVLGWLLVIRRFHDIDASGWWSLTLIVPLVNLVTLLVLLFKRGDASANRFGPLRPTPNWERILGIIYIVLTVLGFVGAIIAAIAFPEFVDYQMHGMN